jgi:hypothetical protein
MPPIESFRGIHQGATIVVCGCGGSLNDLSHPERHITIGVNDVGRRFDPTYLVVVNPPRQFAAERFRHVQQSRAKHVFTHLELGLTQQDVVRFQLGTFGGTAFDDPRVLHYTRNSPYVAICLALHMGAQRIGVIGVDFTDHHFFGSTGRHPLASHLDVINAEYARLRESAASRGVELVNLSAGSRLTALPKAAIDRWLNDDPSGATTTAVPMRRVFGVTYRFLACGDVFTTGLRNAAAELGVDWTDASWDDAHLPAKVAACDPDLLFVVHGRRFVQRWGSAFERYRSAVWLLDEPYEVDDTSRFSSRFHHVFLNDPATLTRHAHAHYLPVCYDPAAHYSSEEPRCHGAGFVGGANPTRERFLAGLALKGRLDYVVGGPWRHEALQRLTRGRTIPAAATADLYRATRIVVNVFRDLHHFNREHVVATSMNPRIYEALACGALVVSEPRPEIASAIPELPVFASEEDLAAIVDRFVADPEARETTRAECLARVRGATYANRLSTVMATVFDDIRHPHQKGAAMTVVPTPAAMLPDGWEACGPVEIADSDEALRLRTTSKPEAGSERGIVTAVPHGDHSLSFELFLPSGSCFIAKIHQSSKLNQQANSYHLYCDDGAYLARHFCVFKTLDIPRDRWVRIGLERQGGLLRVFAGDRLVHAVRDALLTDGFAFLGVKRGHVLLRDIRVDSPSEPAPALAVSFTEGDLICLPAPDLAPRVSIVTTVYDRIECLTACIRSVRRLHYTDYEHLIVSDCPAPAVVERIAALVRSFGDGRISYTNLRQRHNNWGIAPASVGLRQTRGEYVCFLSDDNGYTPDHVGTLVKTLDKDRSIGFAYSSCHYAGRLTLRHSAPAPARIDLGQPTFRRALFATHLGDDLPFQMMAWDWALIDTLVKHGVRWKHVDVPSFVFRLAQYPHLMEHA